MKTFLKRSVLPLILGAVCLETPLGWCDSPGPAALVTQSGDHTDINKSDTQGNGGDFLGQIRHNQKFLIVRRGKHRADLTVSINGRLIYTMPDEALNLPSEHFDPGETYKGYDFYLSPDHLNLLVVRGLVHSLAVAYLYTRSGPGRMKSVRPGGLRLDDAALRYYCRQKGMDENVLGSAGRMIRFVEWDTPRHRLIFTMWSASYWGGSNPHRGDVSASWYTAYDLKTRRFQIIAHPQGLPEPQVS